MFHKGIDCGLNRQDRCIRVPGIAMTSKKINLIIIRIKNKINNALILPILLDNHGLIVTVSIENWNNIVNLWGIKFRLSVSDK